MNKKEALTRELLWQWVQDSLDARYRTCETDATVLKWLATSNADPKKLVDAVYKQLEFWGEGTWGESFLVAPSDILASELKLPQEALNGHALSALLTVLHNYKYLNSDPPRPPFNAEYLLYLFLDKPDRDVVIGDLVESYGRIIQRFGKRRADLWFYKQVAACLTPLIRRALLKLGAVIWLGRILRRLIS